jgi:chemotaxis protein methyltransferase CheR
MTITTLEFDTVRTLVHRGSGIVLEPGKEYLVESRLAPLARAEGYPSLGALVAELGRPAANGLARRVVEAMTTNETSFFRDVHPFEALRTRILPELLGGNPAAPRRLAIWSAACSTGQEAVSLGILLREHFLPAVTAGTRIVGTDLSADVLARARALRFSQLEVNRGLPAQHLVRHFTRDGLDWVASPELQRLMEWRQLNLTEAWPALPTFDLVMLRNVLIYFDVPTKQAILRRVRAQVRPGGWLLLGGAETTLNLDDAWERHVLGRVAAYRAPGR